MIKRIAAAAALAGGGGVAYVASDPNTEIVLYDFDDGIDDEACKACEFDVGAECWCPPPGQPITEQIVCGCYTPPDLTLVP
jgi:hypothetical protein